MDLRLCYRLSSHCANKSRPTLRRTFGLRAKKPSTSVDRCPKARQAGALIRHDKTCLPQRAHRLRPCCARNSPAAPLCTGAKPGSRCQQSGIDSFELSFQCWQDGSAIRFPCASYPPGSPTAARKSSAFLSACGFRPRCINADSGRSQCQAVALLNNRNRFVARSKLTSPLAGGPAFRCLTQTSVELNSTAR